MTDENNNLLTQAGSISPPPKGQIKPNSQPSPGPIGNTQGLILPNTSPNASGADNSAPTPEPQPKEEGWWKSWGSDVTHGVLDVVGLIPFAGELADGANALVYTAEGDAINAAISVAAMVPLAGDAVTAGKWAMKAEKAAVKQLEKQALKEAEDAAIKKLEKEAAEKLEKEAAEKAAKEKGGHINGTNHEKAAFGEKTAHDKMLDKGYEPVGKTDGIYEKGKTGIDGVYKSKTPPPDYVITEVKYGSSKLGKTADGKQMSDDWLTDKRLIDKVGRKEADAIKQAMKKGNIEKRLIQVGEDGSTSMVKLGKDAEKLGKLE